jgi:hypothetical protein
MSQWNTNNIYTLLCFDGNFKTFFKYIYIYIYIYCFYVWCSLWYWSWMYFLVQQSFANHIFHAACFVCLILNLYSVFHKCMFGFVPTVCALKKGGGGVVSSLISLHLLEPWSSIQNYLFSIHEFYCGAQFYITFYETYIHIMYNIIALFCVLWRTKQLRFLNVKSDHDSITYNFL